MQCIAFSFALSACLVLAGVTHADSLRLTAPEDETTVKGAVKLIAEWDDKPSGATVTYQLNDRRTLAEGLGEPPFAHTWATIALWDGPMLLRAIGRDAQGEVIARSDVVEVTVDNPRGGTIRVISPDLEKPLSGTVEWTVAADREPWPEEDTPEARRGVENKPIEAILFFIDGKLAYLKRGGKRGTHTLDTTMYDNGEHELFAASYTSAPHAKSINAKPSAMIQRVVAFDNGHTLQQVRPRWNELHLRPGETTSLEPMAHYTDGDIDPWSGEAEYSSDNPDVVKVDDAGNVTAVAPGTTRITLKGPRYREAPSGWAEAHDAHTWVTVTETPTRLHLARDGAVLDEYDPERSIFVRTMFYLSPDFIEKKPKLAQQAKAAGVNTLSTGFYRNPVHGGGDQTFDQWRDNWERFWRSRVKPAEEHGFALLLIGDSICRMPRELHNTLTNPWARDALQFAFRKAGQSGHVVGIEMVDEVSMIWGSTPRPEDGRWQKRKPSIPDDAFVRLTDMIREVSQAPPITWPVIGHSSPPVNRNWNEDPQFADYYSHYWAHMDWRKAYPWGGSMWQTADAMFNNIWERRAAVDIPKPEMMLVSLTGPHYNKRVPGDRYTPGKDELRGPGIPTFEVSAQAILAASEGAIGLRGYSYDGLWMRKRETKPTGSRHQTGAAPTGPGAARWRAISNAFNVLKELEPVLLQPSMHALDLGQWVETGARQGPHGRLLMAVNLSEMPVTRDIDLRPYLYEQSTTVQRYRVTAESSNVQRIDGETDNVRFAPGEGVIWHVEPPAP